MSDPGTLLAGRYRLNAVIATGGMGVVWDAWDERLGRPVAIKQLRPTPGVSDAEAEMATHRAMREARITAKLHHPNAVPVLDAVEHDGQPCLVMQLLDAKPLSAVIRESEPLPLERVARIGAEIGLALAEAHRLGIVHRDVKPGNILITADGTAHISDFGISRAMGDATLTSTGLVHGTPAYLSPEVARGQESSFASDVFSLGSTLYAALEGAPPFGSDANAIALLHRVATAEVTPSSRAGQLTPLLAAMLAPDAEARPTMDAVAAALADLRRPAQPDDATTTLPQVQPTGPGPIQGNDDDPTTGLNSWFPARDDEPTGEEQALQREPARPQEREQRSVPAPSRVADATPHRFATPVAPTRPTDREHRRRPRAAVLVGGGALVALAAWLALALPGMLGDDPAQGDPAAAPTTSLTQTLPTTTRADESSPAETAAGSSAAETTADEPTSDSPTSQRRPDPTTEREPTTKPTQARPTTDPAPSTQPEPTTQPTTDPTSEPTTAPVAGDRATQLSSALTGYYGLMPGNPADAWPRMTAAYQTNHAGGYSAYQRFWSAISDVDVSNVDANPPDSVVATLTYYYDDGRVAVERTAYRMVDEGGILKIADSDVLTSRDG